MSKTTKITRRKERPLQPGAICTLILHKNFLLESHLEVFAADREEDSSDESSKDEVSQYNYEFKTFCTFTVFVVLKSTFVRLVKLECVQTSAQLSPFSPFNGLRTRNFRS
jgi:fucose permease